MCQRGRGKAPLVPRSAFPRLLHKTLCDFRMNQYLKAPISNGNPKEQALIRRWWHEKQNKKGALIWEYHLEGKYADAIWIPYSSESGVDYPGKGTAKKFPITGVEIVLCEAKLELTPEVVGQALVYTQFAKHAGASVLETILFCEKGGESMLRAANELGLNSEIAPLD